MGQIAVPEVDEDLKYDTLRQRTLDAAMFDEPQFTLQRQGEHKPSKPQPLSELLDQNRDDEDLCEWLRLAQLGASYIVGGGAAPAISVRRVS